MERDQLISKFKKLGGVIDPNDYGFVFFYPPFTWLETLKDPLTPAFFSGVGDQEAVIYVHIPFCYHECSYCYFTKFSRNIDKIKSGYIAHLKEELKLCAKFLSKKKIKAIYFGGGTPSILAIDEVGQIQLTINSLFDTNQLQEITFECSPETLMAQKEGIDFYLNKLKDDIGITRISLGVQSFNDDILESILGRKHSADQAKQAIGAIKKANFRTFNIDLMYGFPQKNFKSAKNALKADLEILDFFKLPSITFYQLWGKKDRDVVLNKPIWQLEEYDRPKAVEIINFRQLILQSMNDSGYNQWMRDWFIKEEKDKFLYNTFLFNSRTIIGTGLGAYGYLNISRDNAAYAYKNHTELEGYYNPVDSGKLPVSKGSYLKSSNIQLRKLILELKTEGGVNIDKEWFNASRSKEKIKNIENVFITKTALSDKINIKLTESGRLIADEICEYFFDAMSVKERGFANLGSVVENALSDFPLDQGYLDSTEKYEKELTTLTKRINCHVEQLSKYEFLSFAINSIRFGNPVFTKIPEGRINKRNYSKARKIFNVLRSHPAFLSIFELCFSDKNVPFWSIDFYWDIEIDQNNEKTHPISIDKFMEFVKNDFYKKLIDDHSTLDKELLLQKANELQSAFNELISAFSKMPTGEAHLVRIRKKVGELAQENDFQELRQAIIASTITFYLYQQMTYASCKIISHIPGYLEKKKSFAGFIAGFADCLDLEELGYFHVLVNLIALGIQQRESKYELLRHALNSAISGIIARNYSHHIGSHVMPRTSVEQIRKKIVDRLVSEGLCKIIDCLKTRLDKYIQKKADFSAEIATEPLITTKTLSFYTEVIVPFITNTLLMDNLCTNEGIGYPKRDDYGNRLKIIFKYEGKDFNPKFSCRNNHPLNGKKSYPYSASCPLCSPPEKFEFEEIEEKKDIEIAVPGPLGEYAFYSFLENFIRNAAKHNRKKFEGKKNKNLEIHIEISEIKDKDIKDQNNRDLFKEGDKDEYYKIEVWDNVTMPDKQVQEKSLVDFINDRIKDPIIKEDGSIRKEAWGVAEMKIMATLLRGSHNFLRLHENLLARKIKKDNKLCLVYVFKIMKPKKVAVISKSFSETDGHKKYGIRGFKTISEFIEFMKHALSLASFEFAIMDNKEDLDKNKKEILSLAPFRILETNTFPSIQGAMSVGSEFINQIKSLSPEKLYIDVWRKWIEHIIKSKRGLNSNPCVVVYLEQSKEQPPTKDWYDFDNNFKKDDNKPVKLHVMGSDNMKPPDNHPVIMYDRHFGAYNKLAKKNNVLFHEVIDKNSSDFAHVFIPPDENIVYELVESGLVTILIIDERIAERAYDEIMANDPANAKEAYKGLTRLHAGREGGIFICTHLNRNEKKEPEPIHHSVKEHFEKEGIKIEVNLWKEGNKGNDLHPTICLCKKNDNEENREEIALPDILIIHQGIIENFIEGIDDCDSFIDNLKKYIPYVVVTSGRGIPPNLPDTAKFLPISLLEGYVMGERLAKYCLVRFLMALNRRIR